MMTTPDPPSFPSTNNDSLTESQLEEAHALKQLTVGAKNGERDRLELGRRLAGIRPTWARSGPRAAGWQLFLCEIGIEKRTAQRYMRAAFDAEKVRDTVSQKPRLTLLERVLKLVRQLPSNDRAVVLDELVRVPEPIAEAGR